MAAGIGFINNPLFPFINYKFYADPRLPRYLDFGDLKIQEEKLYTDFLSPPQEYHVANFDWSIPGQNEVMEYHLVTDRLHSYMNDYLSELRRLYIYYDIILGYSSSIDTDAEGFYDTAYTRNVYDSDSEIEYSIPVIAHMTDKELSTLLVSFYYTAYSPSDFLKFVHEKRRRSEKHMKLVAEMEPRYDKFENANIDLIEKLRNLSINDPETFRTGNLGRISFKDVQDNHLTNLMCYMYLCRYDLSIFATLIEVKRGRLQKMAIDKENEEKKLANNKKLPESKRGKRNKWANKKKKNQQKNDGKQNDGRQNDGKKIDENVDLQKLNDNISHFKVWDKFANDNSELLEIFQNMKLIDNYNEFYEEFRKIEIGHTKCLDITCHPDLIQIISNMLNIYKQMIRFGKQNEVHERFANINNYDLNRLLNYWYNRRHAAYIFIKLFHERIDRREKYLKEQQLIEAKQYRFGNENADIFKMLKYLQINDETGLHGSFILKLNFRLIDDSRLNEMLSLLYLNRYNTAIFAALIDERNVRCNQYQITSLVERFDNDHSKSIEYLKWLEKNEVKYEKFANENKFLLTVFRKLKLIDDHLKLDAEFKEMIDGHEKKFKRLRRENYSHINAAMLERFKNIKKNNEEIGYEIKFPNLSDENLCNLLIYWYKHRNCSLIYGKTLEEKFKRQRMQRKNGNGNGYGNGNGNRKTY